MPLNERFRYHRAMLMFKCLNNLAPAYLCENFIQINQMHNHNTRHALNSLATPKIRTECFRNSPIVTGINVWNSLDQSLRNASSFTSFKFSLRESFMQCIYIHFYLFIYVCLFLFCFCFCFSCFNYCTVQCGHCRFYTNALILSQFFSCF